MSQQKINMTRQAGADSRQVLDKLTPKNTALGPAVVAEFLGQIHIDTAAKKAYIAVAVGSVTPADDWKEITNVAG